MAGLTNRRGIYYVTKRVDGKLYAYSTGKKVNKRNEAYLRVHGDRIWQDKYNELQLSLNKKDSVTLEEYGLSYYQNSTDARESDMQKRYLREFKNFIVPIIGNLSIKDITVSNLERWQYDVQYYPNKPNTKLLRGYKTIKNYRIVLNNVLNRAVDEKIIRFNPLSKVTHKKKYFVKKTSLSIEAVQSGEYNEDIFSDETVTYSFKDIELLIKTCDKIIASKRNATHRHSWQVFREMLIVKFFSGLRTGETIALLWKNIDFTRKKIYVQFTMNNGNIKAPKNGEVREIDMLPQVEKALLRILDTNLSSKDKSFVFITQNRETPYTRTDAIAKLWNQLLNKTDLKKARFYNTRHSFVTNMLSENVSPEWLIQQVGHKNLLVTREHYQGKINVDVTTFNAINCDI